MGSLFPVCPQAHQENGSCSLVEQRHPKDTGKLLRFPVFHSRKLHGILSAAFFY